MKHINELDPPLSTRARNVLLFAGQTCGDSVQWLDCDTLRANILADGGRELLRLPNCGRTTALEICAALGIPSGTLRAFIAARKDAERQIACAVRLLTSEGWRLVPPDSRSTPQRFRLRDSENMGEAEGPARLCGLQP